MALPNWGVVVAIVLVTSSSSSSSSIRRKIGVVSNVIIQFQVIELSWLPSLFQMFESTSTACPVWSVRVGSCKGQQLNASVRLMLPCCMTLLAEVKRANYIVIEHS